MRCDLRGWTGVGSAWIGVAAIAIAFGCERPAGAPPQPGDAASGASGILARVDGSAITVDDVSGGGPRFRAGGSRAALELAIARRLAANEARRRGLAASDAVQEQLRMLRSEAAAREEALLVNALQGALAEQVAVSDEELIAHYEKTKARFAVQRVRLLRKTFDSIEAARAEDARLGSEGRLDAESSEEIGPASMQELLQRGILGVMRLREPGQRVVIEREDAPALLELVEVLPAEPPPFEAVREQLEIELRAQRAAEAFSKLGDELRGAAKIEIDEAAIAKAEAEQPSSPGAMPPHPMMRGTGAAPMPGPMGPMSGHPGPMPGHMGQPGHMGPTGMQGPPQPMPPRTP